MIGILLFNLKLSTVSYLVNRFNIIIVTYKMILAVEFASGFLSPNCNITAITLTVTHHQTCSVKCPASLSSIWLHAHPLCVTSLTLPFLNCEYSSSALWLTLSVTQIACLKIYPDPFVKMLAEDSNIHTSLLYVVTERFVRLSFNWKLTFVHHPRPF